MPLSRQEFAMDKYHDVHAVSRNWTDMTLNQKHMGVIIRSCFPTKLNSVAWIRERTIPIERPPLVGEVSANFCG
jgi:hypothetical protein